MHDQRPPDNRMQRAVNHKVLGRGRSGVALEQVWLARVPSRWHTRQSSYLRSG